MPESTEIITKLSGKTLRASIGCPQGDFLSPLPWSLVVDDLWELNSDGYYTEGYANDTTILIKANSLTQYQRSYKHLCLKSNSAVEKLIYP
jgi:hypothetical protein